MRAGLGTGLARNLGSGRPYGGFFFGNDFGQFWEVRRVGKRLLFASYRMTWHGFAWLYRNDVLIGIATLVDWEGIKDQTQEFTFE